MIYPVNECYLTIQGEGYNTGIPMVLLRLQGCDVRCPFCDTKETWYISSENEVQSFDEITGISPLFTNKNEKEICNRVCEIAKSSSWVSICGGEPSMHNLKPIVSELKNKGFKCAVETSGTETGHINTDLDWITVSPKIGMPGKKIVKNDAISCADEIKFVISEENDFDKLDYFLANFKFKDNCIICLQPISQNKRATTLCIDSCKQNGWRLSIQCHKYVGFP